MVIGVGNQLPMLDVDIFLCRKLTVDGSGVYHRDFCFWCALKDYIDSGTVLFFTCSAPGSGNQRGSV